MKITFLSPTPGFSGGCRVIAIYAQGLADKGHQVTIVTMPSAKPTLRSNIKRMLKNEAWIKQRSNQEILENSHFNALNGVDINMLDMNRPIQNNDVPGGDVVIATFWITAEWIAELDNSKGKKFYFVQGHELFWNLLIDRVEATYRLPLQKITIAQWLVDIMSSRYGDNKVDLVPNGVDLQQFFAEPRHKQINPTFCVMYACEEFKGLDVSLAAFVKAKLKYPNAKLLAFGSRPVNKDFPLPAGTTYFESPSQDKIREIYSQSDALLFSSRSEGFGLPILEAMACRCPVIATKAGCAPDFIVPSVNGELNEIDDVAAQAESIIKVIEMDNSTWQKMSCKALERVENHSWEKSVNLFENALRI